MLLLVILCWFVHELVAKGALDRKLIIEEEQVEVRPERISPSCLDTVCLLSCRKYFSNDGWMAITSVCEAVKKNSVWFCGRCTLQIDDETQSSIQCYSCLSWYHFKCVGLKKGMKKAWFCCTCLKD